MPAIENTVACHTREKGYPKAAPAFEVIGLT
jgi:hypothetical protein